MKPDEFKPRSESIRVRNNLDSIETALANGASRQDVYEWMRTEHGLTMTFKAFVTALQRQRLKRKESQAVTAPKPPKVEQAIQAAPAQSAGKPVQPTPQPAPENPQTPLDPYSARKARETIQNRDYSDLEDNRYK